MQLESFRRLYQTDPSTNFEQTLNIEEAERKGAELDLIWAATDRITPMSSLGYMDREKKATPQR